MGRLKILSQLVDNSLKDNLRLSPTLLEIYKKSQELVIQKATQLNMWYTRTIGLDEVRQYHERVVTLQDKLLQVQEKRRETGWLLTEIRKKSNELQDQLLKVKRQDDPQRFLDLMRAETEAIKTEHEIQGKSNRYDLEEREVFTAFTNAIRDSHEKQRAQLEYTKYLGIILSIVGSFLAFCYSKFSKQDWNSIAQQLQRNQYEIAALAQNNQINQNKIVNLLNDNKKLMNTKPNPITVYVPAVSNKELTISNKQFEVMAILGSAVGAFFLMLCCCCR